MKNKKQVVILAGGESSRFYPFNSLHKSLFSIGGEAILNRVIGNILVNESFEVIIVLEKRNFEEEKKMIEDFGYGNKVKFATQDEPRGQADSILSAKKLINDNFFVINAQQLNFLENHEDFLLVHNEEKSMVVVGYQETDDPQKYGVLAFQGSKVVGVVEKPEKEKAPSNKRIVGIYYFTKDFLNELEKTSVSTYSLEETLNRIAQEGRVSCVRVKGELLSLKYPWDVFAFKERFWELLEKKIDPTATIADTALIRGDVYIGKNAKIYDYSIIEGPAYVGDDVVVGAYCQVRGGTFLENGSCVQRYVDIKNTILGENSSVHSGFVGDSIIGKNVKIGAGFITANKRLDRGPVKCAVKDEKVMTNIANLGVFVGDNSSIGIHVSTMPGSVVAPNDVVFPGEIIKGTRHKKKND